jgi:eukaryotic-like serine/threonine-protein kinase
VEALIGSGGMGAVYRAWDCKLDLVVALKTVLLPDARTLTCLIREFRLLHDIYHPNLITFGELYEDDGLWFFTMEYVEGQDIIAHVGARGSRPEPERLARLCAALRGLAEALRWLHAAGFVHRDVKPSNTCVMADGRVVLLDFGISTAAEIETDARRYCAGTPGYVAPEQAAGTAPHASADCYSLGVVLLEALDGGPRHAGSARVSRHDSTSAESLHRLGQRLIAEDADSRPSAGEVCLQLGAATETYAPGVMAVQTPFVGRTEEMTVLAAALAQALAGNTVVAELTGESGIGKTALLRHFLSALEPRHGTAIFSARCSERETVPFGGLDGIVDAIAAYVRRLPKAKWAEIFPSTTAVLTLLFPSLVGIIESTAGEKSVSADAAMILRQDAIEAMRGVVSRLCEHVTPVVVLDDFQWIGSDGAAMLDALLRPRSRRSMLVVLASRTERAAHAQGVTPDDRLRLRLGPLASREATLLVHSLTDVAVRPPVAVDPSAIVADAGGHPMFVQELVRHMLASASAAPTRLHDALHARIEGLDGLCRELLVACAISRTPIDEATLRRSVSCTGAQFVSALSRLRADRFVRLARRSVGREVEVFHHRILNAALDRVSSVEQKQVHLRVADSMEALAPDAFESLAFHFQGAGEYHKARHYGELAGDAAHDALAFDRAAVLYRAALDTASGADARDVTLYEKLAIAQRNSGAGSDAAVSFARAAALEMRSDERARLERLSAEQLLRDGHFEAGLGGMRRALSEAGASLPATAARAYVSLLWERGLLGMEMWRRRELPVETRQLDLRRIDTCSAVASSLSFADPLRSAVLHTRQLRLARRSGDESRLGLALCAETIMAAGFDPLAPRVALLLTEIESIQQQTADPRLAAHLALTHSAVALCGTDWIRAAEHGEQAEALLEPIAGAWRERATAHYNTLTALWHLGRIDELRTGLLRALAHARARKDEFELAHLHTGLSAPLHLIQDEPDAARLVLDESNDRWANEAMFAQQRWQILQSRSLVELYQGRPHSALALFRAWPLRESVLLWQARIVRFCTRYMRAIAALGAAALGGLDSRGHLRHAAADIRALERGDCPRADKSVVHFLQAQAAHIQGDRSFALRALDEAERGYSERRQSYMTEIVRRGRGIVQGGAAGRRQVEVAEQNLRALHIVRPDRFASMFAAGLREDHSCYARA